MTKVKTFLELIKFEHTIFALPFAYLGMLTAAPSAFSWKVFVWVTLAMAGARTAAMLLNRVIDRAIDARNPRTQHRATVTGAIPIPHALAGASAALVVFFLSAWMLNPLCFKGSFIAILFLTGYHYVKRFSFLCHYVLGLTLAIAPMGGWLAVRGEFALPPFFLSLAVLFWVAGFDIFYALQDLDFDRANGLHSIPVRYGQSAALRIAAYSHAAMTAFLVIFGVVMGFGWIYQLGVAVCATILFIEHRLVGDGDPTKINAAFFTVNGWVGILLLVFTFLEVYR